MNEEAQITIRRGKGFADMARSYKVVVDGVVAAKVRAGESLTIPVTSGSHTVELRIDWCGSETIDFEIRPGERLDFECGSNLTGWRILLGHLIILLRPRKYLWLRQAT